MKLLTTIVVLLSVSSTAAAGLSRPGRHQLSTPGRTVKEATRGSKAFLKNHEPTESALAIKGGGKDVAASEDGGTTRLVRFGDVGNFITFVLSIVLLIKTVTTRNALDGLCEFDGNVKCIMPENTETDGLDDCYICNSFCVANHLSIFKNSHMLSLYVDLIMASILLWIRLNRTQELKDLGLDEYYLNNMRVISVVGHGIGHLICSLIALNSRYRAFFFGGRATYVVVGTMVAAHLISKDTLLKLKSVLGIIEKDAIGDAETIAKNDMHIRFLKKWVAPFLAPIAMTQYLASGSSIKMFDQVFEKFVFGAVILILLQTAAPPGTAGWISYVGAAILVAIAPLFTPKIIEGAPPDLGPSFILVFTSTIAFGSIALLLQDSQTKKDEAKIYTSCAWISNLGTTLVGWALALSCTALLKVGGHVLYDFSIPASYLLLYFIMRA